MKCLKCNKEIEDTKKMNTYNSDGDIERVEVKRIWCSECEKEIDEDIRAEWERG